MLRSAGGYLAGKVSRVKHVVQFLGEGGSKSMLPNLLATLNGEVFLPVSGCAPIPPPQPPTESLFLSKHHVLSPAIHRFRLYYMRNAQGDSEKQLAELKMRLVTLRRYMPEATCEDIVNDPRLDLKTLPLLSKIDVSECITKYISVLRSVDLCETRYKLLIFLVMGDYIELSAIPQKLVEILTMQNIFLKLESLNLTFVVEEYIDLCSEYRVSSSEVSKNELLEKLQNDVANDMNRIYTRVLDEVFFGI